jgi:uncharacterized membrane protein required for colicin V production
MLITALDIAVIVLLALIAVGGYYQGFIRGLTRTAALIVVTGGTFLLSAGMRLQGSIQNIVIRTVILLAGVMLVIGALTWLFNRSVPRAFHESLLNKILGIVPALLQGLIVLSLLLGFVHRVALEVETQQYIAHGSVTGPLIQPFAWLEQSLSRAP